MSSAKAYRNIAVASLLLLPASCAIGSVATSMWDARQYGDGDTNIPLWAENLLWIATIAIVLLWGWLVDRFWKSGESE